MMAQEIYDATKSKFHKKKLTLYLDNPAKKILMNILLLHLLSQMCNLMGHNSSIKLGGINMIYVFDIS